MADWPVLGGGFAGARNLVRIFSSDCPNTPAAVLRTGAADLKASASAAGPLALRMQALLIGILVEIMKIQFGGIGNQEILVWRYVVGSWGVYGSSLMELWRT